MADPLTMTAIATVASTAAAAGTAYTTSKVMNAQAAADQQRAATESEWATRRATDERAAAQQAANEELRKAKIAQSRLGAVAGGSGSRVDDPTVLKLFDGIDKEGSYNAAAATAAGEQRASGISYQSALDRWTADGNAEIKRYGAKSTLIGGLLSAAGTGIGGYGRSRMAIKYGDRDIGTVGSGTGYG